VRHWHSRLAVFRALQALITNKVVNWTPLTVVWIACAVGLVTFLDNLRLLYQKFNSRERKALRAKMHIPLMGALDAVASAQQVPLASLGISVFKIRLRLGRVGHVIPWPQRRLVRVYRFRLSEYPPPSKIIWNRGKGTIGECWRTGIAVLHDRRGVAARYGGDRHPTEQSYKNLPRDVQTGFTHAEFIRTIDKYGEIVAVPIAKKHTGDLIGFCPSTAWHRLTPSANTRC
jgi:hypothetical protein